MTHLSSSSRGPTSVPNPKFDHFAASTFANFGFEGHQQIIDLVWLWFRSPHCELAAIDADF